MNNIALVLLSVYSIVSSTCYGDSLGDISRFAQDICGQVNPNNITGEITRKELEGKLEAQAVAIKKLLGISLNTDGKINDTKYKGLPYDKVAENLKDARECKKELAKLLISERNKISQSTKPDYKLKKPKNNQQRLPKVKAIENLAQQKYPSVAPSKNIQDANTDPVQSATNEVDMVNKEDKRQAMRKTTTPHDISYSESEGDYWHHGNPTWDDLKRQTKVGNGERFMEWSEGCHYCEAERPSKTRCWPRVELAKQYGWKHGFIGYNPKQKAWCKLPPSAARIEPNSEIFWLE